MSDTPLRLTLRADLARPTHWHIACIVLALKLRPKYGALSDTFVDLIGICADAPIEIKARAHEDRLVILKTSEAQAAPDAWLFPNRQMCKILKISGRCLISLLILPQNLTASP